MSIEKHEFEAEVKQLLDLMIHSLYSNKEVFLRELISNASDAIDRVRFLGVTKPEVLPTGSFEMVLAPDKAARTLEIRDNGIGMTRDEVIAHLGTVAKSGTAEFLKNLRKSDEKLDAPELIGQFGVGFYSAFMVADEITVTTRMAGETTATVWHSDGGGGYTLDEGTRDEAGTSVVLKLKDVDADDGISDFTDEWVLRQIVKKYSDFVAYPIMLDKSAEPAPEPSEDGADSADAADATDATDGVDDAEVVNEPLNSMKAIWTRPESEVTDEEYTDFYKHITHDFREPLLHVSSRMEGTFEARSLLYLPAMAPPDLYHREMAHRGIQLYVRKVFIMDECRELMPDYLRFVRGVVDAEDVSLNVSREMLQQDRQISAIRKYLVKKVLDELKVLKKNDEEKYLQFWGEFGAVVKEGLLQWEEKKDRILDLVLARSTNDEGKLTNLDEYVERMQEGQEEIYYLVGPSIDILTSSPHLEGFKAKGIEVLLLADPVDEVWLQQMPPEFKGKTFKSAGRGIADLDDEEEKGEDDEAKKEEETFKDLVAALGKALEEDAKEVRVSKRLTTSPACIVLEEGEMTPQLEAMLRQAGQEVPKVKPVLEVNAGHPLVVKLQEIFDANAEDPRIASHAELLFGQALLAEGGQLADPAAFSKKLADLMLDAIN